MTCKPEISITMAALSAKQREAVLRVVNHVEEEIAKKFQNYYTQLFVAIDAMFARIEMRVIDIATTAVIHTFNVHTPIEQPFEPGAPYADQL